MRKKGRRIVILVAAIFMLLVFSGAVFAFQNEPEGFRGLKWGDPPTEEMEWFMEAAGTDAYLLPDDKMALGNANLYMIAYTFYENQFLAVALYFKGEDNYDLLQTICEERYGEDEMDEGFYETTWQGQKGFVSLDYDYVEEEGYLVLGNTILTLKKTADEKEKEAEKAAGDW